VRDGSQSHVHDLEPARITLLLSLTEIHQRYIVGYLRFHYINATSSLYLNCNDPKDVNE